MVVVSRCSASATAVGATSRILIELMMFGMWRGDQGTRLVAKLKAQYPIVAGGDRLQTPVQGKRERQRFEIGLHIRILSKIADSGHLDIDRRETAAGGE